VKLIVMYEADGTQSITVEGYRIKTTLRKGVGLVTVFDEDGDEVRALHFGKVYLMDKDKT
jgi:hypothetical protein